MALSEDDFYTAVHRTAWKRRSTGMMAGITLGLGLGLLIGCAVAFLPYLLASAGLSVVMTSGAVVTGLPAMSAIGASALTFGSVGAFTGVALGTDVGAAAGAVSAAFNVQQRTDGKDKERHSPEELAIAAKPRGAGRYLNWKVGLACAVLFGAFGALLSFGAATAIGVSMLGIQAGTAGTIASGVTFGMLGATMGVNAPLITAELSNAYEKLVTGKVFEHSAPPAEAPTRGVSSPERTATTTAPARPKESFEQATAQSQAPSQAQAMAPWADQVAKTPSPATSHGEKLQAERAAAAQETALSATRA